MRDFILHASPFVRLPSSAAQMGCETEGKFAGICTIRQNSLMVSVVSFHLMRNWMYKLQFMGRCHLRRPK